MSNPNPNIQIAPGKVQVISGREITARCTKCGSDSWHIMGEVRREEKDNPHEVKAQAMRMVCTKCHGWMYIEQMMQPVTPRVVKRNYVNGQSLKG